MAQHYQQAPWAIQLHHELPHAEEGATTSPFRLHEYAAAALQVVEAYLPAPSCYTIYCDASVKPGTRHGAAWALSLLAEDGDRIAFHGWLGGTAAGSLQIPTTDELSSTQAELIGILWAALLAMQLPHDAPVTIVTDSQAAQAILQNLDATTEPLRRVAVAAVAAIAEARPLRIGWTKGHVGHPWNEFCDSIAKHLLDNDPPPLPGNPLWLLTEAPTWDWALLRANPHAAVAYPTMRDDGLHYTIPQHYHPPEVPTHLLPATRTAPQAPPTTVRLRVATYNTRFGASEETAKAARRQRSAHIRINLQQDGVHLAGLQETLYGKGSFPANQMWLINTGPIGKAYGVTLAVNLVEPYAITPHGDLYFKPQHFKIVHMRHRILVVRVVAPLLDEYIYVLHGPHESVRGATELTPDSWWTEVERLMIRWPPGWVLMDANAHLAPQPSPGVGSQPTPGARTQDDGNGGRLRRHLAQFDLTALNTTLPQATDGTTWISHTGARHRIDYIAASAAWTTFASGAEPQHAWDNLMKTPDHYPIYADFTAQRCRTTAANGLPQYDGAKLRDPDLRAHLRRTLQQIPLAPWSLDANTHVEQTNHAVRVALTPFQKGPDTALQPYITPTTMALIRLRRHVQRLVRHSWHDAAAWKDLTTRLPHMLAFYAPEGATWQLPAIALAAACTHYELQTPARSALRVLQTASTHTTLPALLALQGAATAFLGTTDTLVRRAIQADRAAHLDRLGDQIADDIESHTSQAEGRHVQRLLRYGGRPPKKATAASVMPHFLHADGTAIETHDDLQRARMSCFAAKEAARIGTPMEAVQDYNTKTPLHILAAPASAANLLGLAELRARFRRSTPNKAPGGDGISTNALRAAPAELARLYHPPMLKAALHGQEPMVWKHGTAVAIPKPGTSSSDPGAARKIELASEVAKHHHAFLRSRLAHTIHYTYFATQLGGRRHGSCAMAAHMTATFLRVQRQNGQSALVLFVDLVDAFHSVVRQLALPAQDFDEEDVARALSSDHLPTAFHDLATELINAPAALGPQTVDPHLSALTAEAHRSTHFTLPPGNEVAIPIKGTRPGDALADFTFSAVFRRPLERIRDQLHDLGLLYHPDAHNQPAVLAQPGPAEVASDAAYADDVAIMATFSNDQCLPTVRTVIRTTHEAMMVHGLRPNYKVGKTMLFVACHGEGREAAKRLIYGDHAAVTEQNYGVTVPIAHTYKHLGTMAEPYGGTAPSVAHNVGRHRGARGPVTQQLRRHGRRIPIPRKINHVDAMATTHLHYCSETWPRLPDRQANQLHGARVAGYRAMLGWSNASRAQDERTTDDAVLIAAGRPSLEVVQRSRRLRYLCTLLHHGPQALLQLLDCETGPHAWRAQLPDDFAWVATYTLEEGDPKWRWPLRDWLAFARAAPRQYLAQVRAATTNASWRSLEDARHREWERQLQAVADRYDPPAPTPPPPQIQCFCGRTFATEGAYRCHQTRDHNPHDLAQRYAHATLCAACGKDFRTRPRLVHHLRHRNTACLAALPHLIAPLGDARLAELREQDRIDIAALRAQGFSATKALTPVLDVLHKKRGPALGRLRTPLTLVHPPAPPRPAPMLPPTRTPTRCLVVLHLFSGRRRAGDVQDAFERLYPAAPFWVLSLDVAVDPTTGDLTNGAIIQQWIRAIEAGHVLAVIAGPPCETWSAARWERLVDERSERAPLRPVRVWEAIWGIPTATERERTQLQLGNALYRTTILLAQVALATGTSMIIEHPAWARWKPLAVSSWALPQTRALTRRPQCYTVDIDQGAFGAPAKKATTLLAIHLPELRQLIQETPHRGRATTRFQTALGRLQAGTSEFATARLKEYPEELCMLLARAVTTHWAPMFGDAPRQELPSSWAASYQPLDPYLEEQERMADCTLFNRRA